MTLRPRGRRLPGVLAAVLVALLVSTSAPHPVAASAASDAESLLIDLINQDRAAAGLVPLRRNSALAVIAGKRAARMVDANVLSHSVGGDLGKQLDAYDITWYRYGETIAYSTRAWAASAARHLHDVWMASSAHRALLLSSKFNYIGAGLALRTSNDRTYGSVVLTESLDQNGARSWFVSAKRSGDDITWSWSGADLRLQTHTAGLRDYDVQYRVGSGSWRTMRNDSTLTSATLWNRTSGVTYGMRVRATDRRGNIGAWTPESRVTLP